MVLSEELIKNFFEEQFEELSPYFRYKDHQLLKDHQFQEFINRQLDKSRKTYLMGVVLSISGHLLAVAFCWFLIEADGQELLPPAFFLVLGSAKAQHWFVKQHFIIKSSMSLFQKMINKTGVTQYVND